MTSVEKRNLLDYFQATKKHPIAGKDVLRSLKTSGTDKKTLEKHAVVSDSVNEASKVPVNDQALVQFKKRVASSSDNNNNLNPAKRLCTGSSPRKSNLLVNPNDLTKKVKESQPEKKKTRLDKLKDAIARASETLKQSQCTPISTTELQPAHERYAALVAEESEGLVLPHKYKILLETFQCLDTVVSMLYNRKEICFVDKIQSSVKQMTRRSFNLNHLGQVVKVDSEAYHLRLEPVPVNSFHKRESGEVQLTVNPNLTITNTSDKTNKFIPMTPSIMLSRKNNFKDRLIGITKEHHKEFLNSLKISIDQSQVRRWHPAFMVDQVPDIEPMEVPQPNKVKVATAEEVLEKVRGLYCKKLDEALETVAASTANQANSNEIPKKPEAKTPRGVPLALLEKIRAREAAKALNVITRDPIAEKKQRMLSRLPEIARIIKSLFVGDRKTSLIAPYVFKKVIDSYIGSLTNEQVEEHLKMLSELVPEWLSIINLRDGAMYYKLKRETDFNIILKQITSAKI